MSNGALRIRAAIDNMSCPTWALMRMVRLPSETSVGTLRTVVTQGSGVMFVTLMFVTLVMFVTVVAAAQSQVGTGFL
jgi:hypothetical protein